MFPFGNQQPHQYHSLAARAIFESNNFGEPVGSVLCGKNSAGEHSTDIIRHPNSEDEEPSLPSGNPRPRQLFLLGGSCYKSRSRQTHVLRFPRPVNDTQNAGAAPAVFAQ